MAGYREQHLRPNLRYPGSRCWGHNTINFFRRWGEDFISTVSNVAIWLHHNSSRGRQKSSGMTGPRLKWSQIKSASSEMGVRIVPQGTIIFRWPTWDCFCRRKMSGFIFSETFFNILAKRRDWRSVAEMKRKVTTSKKHSRKTMTSGLRQNMTGAEESLWRWKSKEEKRRGKWKQPSTTRKVYFALSSTTFCSRLPLRTTPFFSELGRDE